MSLIFEINKLLSSLYEISKEKQNAKLDFLKTKYQSRRFSKEITDFNTILKFSYKMNLINISDGYINIEKNGMILLEKISKPHLELKYINLEPNDEEINFLKKVFFNSKKVIEEFLEIINRFWVEEHNKKSILTYTITKQDRFDHVLMKFLQEMKIFEIQEKKIICIDELSRISRIKNNVKEISEEELEERLEENKRIGKKGEELAIIEEEKRLRSEEKRVDLALDIIQISITDEFAGFDLKSYDDTNSQLSKHDRFIEVKATKGKNLQFYWSKNEVKKAKEFGEKYWIYLWINIEGENRELKKIKDPYYEFFESRNEKPECTGYFLNENYILNFSE